jgi:hypothetical protein
MTNLLKLAERVEAGECITNGDLYEAIWDKKRVMKDGPPVNSTQMKGDSNA